MAKRLSYEEAVAGLKGATSREEIFEVLERCTMSTLEELVVGQNLHVLHKARDKKSDYMYRIYNAVMDSKNEAATEAEIAAKVDEVFAKAFESKELSKREREMLKAVHKVLVRNGEYDTAHGILRLMRRGQISLGLGDTSFKIERVLEELGFDMKYSRNYSISRVELTRAASKEVTSKGVISAEVLEDEYEPDDQLVSDEAVDAVESAMYAMQDAGTYSYEELRAEMQKHV